MDIPEPATPRRTRLLSVALLATALAVGCASTLDLQAPEISVVSMKIQSADLFAQRLQVRLRVVNPNARELPVKGITYRIEVAETELANGETTTPFVVPANGEAEFDAALTANLASALAKYLSRRGSQQDLDYRLTGEVALSSGFLRRIPFDERGSVKLK